MKKTLAILVFLLEFSIAGIAQYIDSMKGLLMMPSAEMENDGTLSVSTSFLNKSFLENPSANQLAWGYDTFSYGFDITFWSRIEIAYICTYFNGKWSPYAKDYRYKVMNNQDRHFASRAQLVKENEWGLRWLPSILVGISDPVTGGVGDYLDDNISEKGNNGFFNRVYAVASKHFESPVGIFGAHIAYQYTRRKYIISKGPQFGVTWDPVWLNRSDGFLSSCRIIAEYDAKEINVGAVASIWKDHFELWSCLQACRHFNGGIRFKTVLAGAEK